MATGSHVKVFLPRLLHKQSQGGGGRGGLADPSSVAAAAAALRGCVAWWESCRELFKAFSFLTLEPLVGHFLYLWDPEVWIHHCIPWGGGGVTDE